MRPAKAGRASRPPQKHAPRRTALATTPPRPRPATSGSAPPTVPGSPRRTGRARNAPTRNATSSHASDRPASARRARGRTPPPRHAPRTDRRATTAAHGPPGAHGPTRTGPASQRFTKDAPRRTDGHRREHDAREAQPRTRRTRATRDRDAIADVGMYRAVSYTDISEQHYDNHPYVTRRAVNRMVRDGKLEEHEATGPQGNTFTVLTATERGRDDAYRAAIDAGHVPEQQTWTGTRQAGRAVARHGRVPRRARRAGAHRGRRRARRARPP